MDVARGIGLHYLIQGTAAPRFLPPRRRQADVGLLSFPT